MKMQEVITRMREDVPLLTKQKVEAAEQYRTVRGLLQDLSGASSAVGREILSARLRLETERLDDTLVRLFALVERLQTLNDGYTRRLGPKPRKDDPRQQDLPGFDAAGPDDSPAPTPTGGPSWTTSGRHG